MSESLSYYRRRLAEEVAAADQATCAKAAEAHRELAEIYRLVLDQDAPERQTPSSFEWQAAAR